MRSVMGNFLFLCECVKYSDDSESGHPISTCSDDKKTILRAVEDLIPGIQRRHAAFWHTFGRVALEAFPITVAKLHLRKCIEYVDISNPFPSIMDTDDCLGYARLDSVLPIRVVGRQRQAPVEHVQMHRSMSEAVM